MIHAFFKAAFENCPFFVAKAAFEIMWERQVLTFLDDFTSSLSLLLSPHSRRTMTEAAFFYGTLMATEIIGDGKTTNGVALTFAS
jgi:hypothetical protein